MGPHRKPHPQPDRFERSRQELDGVLAESGRLVSEMEHLLRHVRQLLGRSTRTIAESARRRSRRA